MSRAIRSDTLNMSVWPSKYVGQSWVKSDAGKLYGLLNTNNQRIMQQIPEAGQIYQRLNSLVSFIRNPITLQTGYENYTNSIAQVYFVSQFEEIKQNYLDDALNNLKKEFQKETKGFTEEQMSLTPSYAYDQKTGQRLSDMMRHDAKVEEKFQKFADKYKEIMDKAASMFNIKSNVSVKYSYHLNNQSLDGLYDTISREMKSYHVSTYFNGVYSYRYTDFKNFGLAKPIQDWFISLIKNPKEFWENGSELYDAVLFFAAFTEFRKNNPKVKTYGVTDISTYQSRVYFFSQEPENCKKKNTRFYPIEKFPVVSMGIVEKLNNAYIPEALKEYREADKKATADEAIKIKSAQKFVKRLPKLYADYWKKMIQHFYSAQDFDAVGLAYAILLWKHDGHIEATGTTTEETQKHWKKVQAYLLDKPFEVKDLPSSIRYVRVSANYNGFDFSVNYSISAQYWSEQQYQSLGLKTNYDDDAMKEILDMGVPSYLSTPMRDQLTKIRQYHNNNFNAQLQGYARQIMQVENNRTNTMERINGAWNSAQKWV